MTNFAFLANCEIVLALAGWAVGLWGVVSGSAVILKFLYFLAWYPFIFFLDGFLFRLQGSSWLLNRPKDFLKLLFWSTTIWLVFEALNLVLNNWGYVGVISPWWLRWGGYAVAFATVLPGVLLTAEVIAALGFFQKVKGRTYNLGTWQPAALLIGVAMLVVPLIWPHYTFALIWGATFFLLDPFCELLGGPSLIAHFAAGERREHLCLLAAGLVCGLWWESWNWFATSKWVYTLPVLNFGKLFEMPVLGYLGFAPFALECAVMYNFLNALDERVLTTPARRRNAILVQLAFWVVIFAAMDAWTVISYQ